MNQEKIAELEKLIASDYKNTVGIVVCKNGQTLYQKYFNDCHETSRIHVYSVTKSIVSILIGIAIDKGYIKSVNQKVLEFFPDYMLPKGEKTIQNITLENLITMTAPYKYNDLFAPYVKYFTSDNWLHFTLDLLGGKGTIGKFRYAPLIGPDILTGILMRVTGQTVLDFATENLFAPMGITVTDHIVFHDKDEQLAFNQATDMSGWVADPTGLNTGGWGLSLSASDMAKIGQLYLDGGLWHGQQLVSKEWIEMSTTEHSRWSKMNLSYGYLWWLIDEKKQSFAAMGDGGNVIYVNPQNKLVISIAALFVPKTKDRIDLIEKYIEPIFMSEY